VATLGRSADEFGQRDYLAVLKRVSSNMHRFIVGVTLIASVAACVQATVNLPAGAEAIAVSELGNGPVWYSPDTPILGSLSYQDLIASAAATDPRCQGGMRPPRCTAPYPGTDIPPTAPAHSLYLALPPIPYCYDHQERRPQGSRPDFHLLDRGVQLPHVGSAAGGPVPSRRDPAQTPANRHASGAH